MLTYTASAKINQFLPDKRALVLEHLSRNEDHYQLTATERETFKSRLREIQRQMDAQNITFEQWVSMQPPLEKKKDALAHMLDVPEYGEMLLTLMQYGDHFQRWPQFGQVWLSKHLLDCNGLVRPPHPRVRSCSHDGLADDSRTRRALPGTMAGGAAG